jgi:hypothetical protein
MKYSALCIIAIGSLVCTACTTTHPLTVGPSGDLVQTTNTEINTFPDIHQHANLMDKDKYILLSGTTYLYRYALPHEVHIYGSLIDQNISFDGEKIEPNVSFSGETVASIQSGILTYGQIKLKIPT